MAIERRDEFSGWASKLEEPGALPEQGLRDREATWDRLEARMGNGRRRRPVGWMPWRWAAAACLAPLLAVVIWAVVGGAGASLRVGSVPGVAGPGPKAAGPRLNAAGSDSGLAGEKVRGSLELRGAEPAGVVYKSVVSGARRVQRRVRATGSPGVRDSVSLSAGGAASLAGATAGSSAVPDSNVGPALSRAVAMVGAGRKQLRVISINEIPDTDSPQAQMAIHVPVSSHFQIGFRSRDPYRPVVAKQQTAGSAFIVNLSSKYP